jgi:hypothetical protein
MPWENIVEKPTLIPEEVDRAAVDEVLNREDNLYRIAFLPSVLAWVALDYTESVCDQAAQLRLNYKSQVREIKKLTKDFNAHYNDIRSNGVDMMRVNELNGIGLQEQFADTLKELSDEINAHIRYCKPTLPTELLYLYNSVYMAMFAFRALFAYAFECDMYLDREIKSFGNRSILLNHPRKIYRILPHFLGCNRELIRAQDLDDYAHRLVQFVKTAEFKNEHNSN